MSKLTDEQVELAIKYFSKDPEVIVQGVWNLKSCLRNAAPYLQMPWNGPTRKEEDEALAVFSTHRFNGEENHETAIWDLLAIFVQHRNAVLLPKPVDPRRKVIIDTINLQPASSSASTNSDGPVGELADKILTALDEAKL